MCGGLLCCCVPCRWPFIFCYWNEIRFDRVKRTVAFCGLIRSVFSGLVCCGGGVAQIGRLAAEAPHRGFMWAWVIRLAGGGRVWLGVADVARLVGAVAGLGGLAGLVRRACVRGVALPGGRCLCVVVSRALWGVSFPMSVVGLVGPAGVAPSARLVLLPLTFAFLPVPMLFPAPGVMALSPSLPWWQCPCVRVVAQSVQDGRGYCLVVGVWRLYFLRRCSRSPPLWVYPSHLVRGPVVAGRDSVRWVLLVWRRVWVGWQAPLGGPVPPGYPCLGRVFWCAGVPWRPSSPGVCWVSCGVLACADSVLGGWSGRVGAFPLRGCLP